jgi:ketosteroid isomerase-like protein
MTATTAETIVREFWRLMATNDFAAVAVVLSDDFVLEWPQSGERIRGVANFSWMNDEYVSHGSWRFTVNRIIATDNEAVSDVDVTDGVQIGRALSFFTISNGRIARIVEFWPDPFPAPQNRAHLVESIQ